MTSVEKLGKNIGSEEIIRRRVSSSSASSSRNSLDRRRQVFSLAIRWKVSSFLPFLLSIWTMNISMSTGCDVSPHLTELLGHLCTNVVSPSSRHQHLPPSGYICQMFNLWKSPLIAPGYFYQFPWDSNPLAYGNKFLVRTSLFRLLQRSLSLNDQRMTLSPSGASYMGFNGVGVFLP